MAVPNEAGKLTPEDAERRRRLAADRVRTPSGWIVTGWLAGVPAVVLSLFDLAVPASLYSLPEVRLVLVALWITTFAALAIVVTRRRSTGRFSDWLRPQGFPIAGIEAWVVCDRPLADVKTRVPIDVQAFSDVVHLVDRRIEIKPIDSRTIRIAIPPVERGALRCGDVAKLRTVITHAVQPLHHSGSVDRLELGGLVDARS